MRVLVFTTLYPNNQWPNHGMFTKERMAAFTQIDSCRVKVVAPVPYFPPININWRWKYSQVADQEVIEGIEVYHPRYLMTPKLGMATYGILMFLCVLPLLRRIRSNFDFDLIEAHFVYPDGFAAVLLGWFFDKPVVVFSEGTDLNLYPTFPLIRQLLRYTLRKADRVVAVCQALKDVMIRLHVPADKISVISNGVDPKKFYPVSKNEALDALNLPDKTILLSVGALISRKGFDLLIGALDILIRERGHEDLYLLIIGEGQHRKEIEKMIAGLNLGDRVRLLGSIANRELYLWYGAADLFCLASSREGLPCVILEALACGVPVVATAVWGVPEIISSDEVGILTDRSARGIADGIESALKKKWDSDEIVRYARMHTWHQVSRQCHRLFESLLCER